MFLLKRFWSAIIITMSRKSKGDIMLEREVCATFQSGENVVVPSFPTSRPAGDWFKTFGDTPPLFSHTSKCPVVSFAKILEFNQKVHYHCHHQKDHYDHHVCQLRRVNGWTLDMRSGPQGSLSCSRAPNFSIKGSQSLAERPLSLLNHQLQCPKFFGWPNFLGGS